MPGDRRHARVLALQTLCQWDVQGDESLDVPADLGAGAEASPIARDYARKLLDAYWARRREWDRRISEASLQWELDRMSPVERNAMRVAMAEWAIEDVPPKVALNEAIEIAREYGGKDSPAFVNGVLDSVMKSLDRAKRDRTNEEEG